MNRQKGFTIIELVVTVAVVTILSVVVMASVVNYIIKGKNAAIKGNMAHLYTYGTIYYSDNSNFDGFCGSTRENDFESAIRNAGSAGVICSCDTASCNDPATKWCVRAQELDFVSSKFGQTPNYFCADSSGAKKESSSVTCSSGICN